VKIFFENLSITGENMDKNKVPRFYGPPCRNVTDRHRYVPTGLLP